MRRPIFHCLKWALGIPCLPIQIFFELLTRVNSGCDLWERSWSGDANYAMKRQADFLAADSVVLLSLCFLGTMTFHDLSMFWTAQPVHAGPCQVDPWWTHRLEESCSMQRTVASSSSSLNQASLSCCWKRQMWNTELFVFLHGQMPPWSCACLASLMNASISINFTSWSMLQFEFFWYKLYTYISYHIIHIRTYP